MTKMIRFAAAALLTAMVPPVAASAQDANAEAQSAAAVSAKDNPTRRVINLTVFGADPCPKSSPDEIVVCARKPESDRYRIPKALRHKKPLPAEGSWTNNAALLDQVSRDATMPNSCSPNGSNGQTGCQTKLNQQWYAERKQRKAEAAAEDAAAEATIPQ